MRRKLLIAVWLLVPVVLLAVHYGPGQSGLSRDRAADRIARAQAAESAESWSDAVQLYSEALADLPASRAIDEVAQLLKGSSSHWVNESNLVPGKFAWQRGYGAFSISHSAVADVAKYIANQEAHHKKKSFVEELRQLVERYGLEWHEEENR